MLAPKDTENIGVILFILISSLSVPMINKMDKRLDEDGVK